MGLTVGNDHTDFAPGARAYCPPPVRTQVHGAGNIPNPMSHFMHMCLHEVLFVNLSRRN